MALHTLAVLILSLPLVAGPPQQPAAEVVITARALQLPPLPQSVGQARARYGAVKAQVKVGLADLEKDLVAIYADPGAQAILPPQVKVRREQVEEVKFMISIIDDAELERLTGNLHLAWKHYVDVLVANGLAESTEKLPRPGSEPVPAEPPRLEMPAEKPAAEAAEDQAQAKRLARTKRSAAILAGEAKDLAWLAAYRAWHTPLEAAEARQEEADWTLENHARMDDRVAFRRKQIAVADRVAPNLAAVWEPLAAHFNACAEKFLVYDQARALDTVPDLRNLHLQAKLVFLERFRENLWFCDNVWALITSSKAPPPLKKLDPGPGGCP